MACPAACPRAAVTVISGQQAFQQAAAQRGHGGADRQLHRLQATACAQRGRRQRGKALYLGGRLRRERLAEPPLSPAGPASSSAAEGVTGLASQIASFTSTICWESSANCW